MKAFSFNRIILGLMASLLLSTQSFGKEAQEPLNIEPLKELFIHNQPKILQSIPNNTPDTEIFFDTKQIPLIGDINADGKNDFIIPYQSKSKEKYYDMYAIFLSDSDAVNYSESLWRGTKDSFWRNNIEFFSSFLTFNFIDNGVIQAIEESKGPNKKASNDFYRLYQGKLLSNDEISYLESDNRNFLDIIFKYEMANTELSRVVSYFGEPVSTSKERDCKTFLTQPSAQYVTFKNGAQFDTDGNTALFSYIKPIPENFRLVTPRWIITQQMTLDTLNDMKEIDPAYTIVKVELPDNTYYIINGLFYITFKEDIIESIGRVNRCHSL